MAASSWPKVATILVTIAYVTGCIVHITKPTWVPSNLESLVKAIPIWLIALLGLCFGGGIPKRGEIHGSYLAFVFGGLFLSSMGDIALHWSDELESKQPDDGKLWFMSGLLCFLLAHCLYTQAFYPYVRRGDKDEKPPTLFNLSFDLDENVAGFLTCFYSVLMTLILYNNDDKDLIVPILIYGLVICRMAYYCAVRWKLQRRNTKKNNNESNLDVLKGCSSAFYGCAFFLLSDSLLAINKFAFRVSHAHTYVMITYYVAQFLIGYSACGFPLKKYRKRH
jgi:uncharacterized membrane protein YhhN